MFEFLKRIKPSAAAPNSVAPDSMQPGHSLRLGPSRRETIRVVFKDTLRLHGIPPDWLACDVLIVRRSDGSDQVHIQLVLLKWNEKLLRYAPALEQQLRHELNRFDPTVDHSGYIISWRFSPDEKYPFSAMPDPKFWSKRVAEPGPAAEEPIAILDRRRTKRPAKPTQSAPADAQPHQDAGEYPATQIAPLQ